MGFKWHTIDDSIPSWLSDIWSNSTYHNYRLTNGTYMQELLAYYSFLVVLKKIDVQFEELDDDQTMDRLQLNLEGIEGKVSSINTRLNSLTEELAEFTDTVTETLMSEIDHKFVEIQNDLLLSTAKN